MDREESNIGLHNWPPGEQRLAQRSRRAYWHEGIRARLTMLEVSYSVYFFIFFPSLNIHFFFENTQWWNIQQKREQTTLWTLTNEKCGPTTKAKTKKKQKKTSRRERERGRGKVQCLLKQVLILGAEDTNSTLADPGFQ